MNYPLLVRQLNFVDLLEFLDAALYLPGFGGLIAETIDERFEMMNLLLLIFLACLELSSAFGLLFQIAVVIAGVEIRMAVPDLQDPVHRNIEKIPIVRDQNVRKRIIVQVFLEPIAGFKIKVIGRLV